MVGMGDVYTPPMLRVRSPLGNEGGRVNVANAPGGVGHNAGRKIKVVGGTASNHHGRIGDAGIVIAFGDNLQVSPIAIVNVRVLLRAQADHDDAILPIDVGPIGSD